MGKVLWFLFVNSGIILGAVFIVFIILDWYNAYMNFIGNTLSIKLLFVLCVTSIIDGILLQIKFRSKKNKG